MIETNFRRLYISGRKLTAPELRRLLSKFTPRRDKDNSTSRGVETYALSHREHFYICRSMSRRTTEYRGVRASSPLSRRKRRPQRAKSSKDGSSHRQDRRRKEVWRRRERNQLRKKELFTTWRRTSTVKIEYIACIACLREKEKKNERNFKFNSIGD